MTNSKAALIQQMKRMMQQRPQDVSEAEWAAVEVNAVEEAHHGAVAALKEQAMELSIKEAVLGLPDDKKSRLEGLFGYGLVEFMKLMADPKTKDNVRLQAIMYIMDHTVGKPKQEIEHSGSLALEVRAHIRKTLELEQASMRTVLPTMPIDKSAQVLDDFLSKHVPDGFVVGKKATTNGNVEE